MNPFLTATGDATPAQSVLTVTPGASALVPPSGPARPTRYLMASASCTIAVEMADQSTGTMTIPATAAGFLIPVAVNKVTAVSAGTVLAFY